MEGSALTVHLGQQQGGFQRLATGCQLSDSDDREPSETCCLLPGHQGPKAHQAAVEPGGFAGRESSLERRLWMVRPRSKVRGMKRQGAAVQARF